MLIEQERIERQEMLVADLHSSTGRFLDNNAPNWLREKIDVQARSTLPFSFFFIDRCPEDRCLDIYLERAKKKKAIE
jgi:hypothetical protein